MAGLLSCWWLAGGGDGQPQSWPRMARVSFRAGSWRVVDMVSPSRGLA